MSDEEKEQTIREENDQGNILDYPAWNRKNAPKEKQDKWEGPIYHRYIFWISNESDWTRNKAVGSALGFGCQSPEGPQEVLGSAGRC